MLSVPRGNGTLCLYASLFRDSKKLKHPLFLAQEEDLLLILLITVLGIPDQGLACWRGISPEDLMIRIPCRLS